MMKMRKEVIGSIIFTILFFITSGLAMLNPAAVYCHELGYEYIMKETPEGVLGICKFPDDTSANAWDFLSGKEALSWSYCTREGYETKHVEEIGTVCILENGSEVEVTKLMKLDFREGRCGDGVCVLGENYENCPEDCPSGSFDGYCDGMKDGRCDPDCEAREDPDCEVTTTLIFTTTSLTTTSTSTTRLTTLPIPTTTTTLKTKREGYLNYFPQLILGLIVIGGVIFLGYRVMKRSERTEKREKDEKIMEWLKKKLKEGEDPEVLRKGLEKGGYDPKLVDEAERKVW